jgi:hypothetical protein
MAVLPLEPRLARAALRAVELGVAGMSFTQQQFCCWFLIITFKKNNV